MYPLLIVYQVAILVVFVALYQKLLFSRGLIHVASFHFFYYFVFYFIGAATLYADGGFTNGKYYFSVTLYPLVAVIGMYVAKVVYRRKQHSLIVNRRNFKYLYLFAIGIALLYALSLAELPVSYVLRGDAAGAAVARTIATKQYEGTKILYYTFRVIVDYFLIYILIYLYIRKDRFTPSFIVSLVGALTIALIDFQKYPAINILVMLFIAIFLYNKAKRVNRITFGSLVNYKVVLILVTSYFVLGALWAAASGSLKNENAHGVFGTVIESANAMVSDRLIYGENRPLYKVYEIVPAKYDYFWGKTFPNPLRILPFEPVPFSYIVYDAVHPVGEGIEGVRGAAPTAFFSVIYANFGFVVSFASMFLFGFVVQLVNDKLLYADKYIIPYRFIILNYITLFATSIDIFFLSEKVILIGLVYLVMHHNYRASGAKRLVAAECQTV